MDYRDNRQRWAESHQVVHFYAGQWCTFTPALTLLLRHAIHPHCPILGQCFVAGTQVIHIRDMVIQTRKHQPRLLARLLTLSAFRSVPTALHPLHGVSVSSSTVYPP